MTKADQAVESAADRLDSFVREARAEGGVKAMVADALAEDPAFLRKLKPSLIAARARGEQPADGARPTESKPRPAPSPRRPRSGGPNPWLVLGAAFAVGYVLAKVVDWRGHAHPRL